MAVFGETQLGSELTYDDWFAWVAPYASAAGCPPEACRYQVDDAGHVVAPCGSVFCRDKEGGSYLAVAEWHVFREWAECLHGKHLVFHAAALECDGQALLLAGPGGAGKSALALALAMRGFAYLGDEFALVDMETHDSQPFPKAICIKDAETAGLYGLDADFEVLAYPPRFTPRCDGAVCCVPRQHLVPSPSQRFPVRWILLLGETALSGGKKPLSKPDAVATLYKSLWNPGEPEFSSVVSLVRKAQTWEVGRDSLERMVDRIQALTKIQQVTGRHGRS